MKAEVKDVLKDIEHLAQCVKSIRFELPDGSWIHNRMPKIGEWVYGRVVLECVNADRANVFCNALIKYLPIKYLPMGDNVKVENYRFASFECGANDDICFILREALEKCHINREMDRLGARARNAEILQDEIETLAQQLPHVKSGMGSRGVKKFRDSVETLHNVVIAQKGYLQR